MAASSGGYETEVPEQLDYFTTNIKVGTEYGKEHWDVAFNYNGSIFHNNTLSMVVDNPFSTVYNTELYGLTSGVIDKTKAPSNNGTTFGPQTGRMDLYPDNNYHQFVTEGAADLGKYFAHNGGHHSRHYHPERKIPAVDHEQCPG